MEHSFTFTDINDTSILSFNTFLSHITSLNKPFVIDLDLRNLSSFPSPLHTFSILHLLNKYRTQTSFLLLESKIRIHHHMIPIFNIFLLLLKPHKPISFIT